MQLNHLAVYILSLQWKGCCCYCYLVAKLCLTLSETMDCGLPGSSVHGISQARILEWVAISSTGHLPDLGSNQSLRHWQANSLPLSHLGSPHSGKEALERRWPNRLKIISDQLWIMFQISTRTQDCIS